mgnify:CR=1 FL=1
MGAIATTVKRDFSFMGKFLFVGMIALLIAMIANMFLQIPALALTISTLVIVVFSLFLLYDLQRIIRGGETNYVMATTGVYMSLFNIFANLLHLLLALAGGADERLVSVTATPVADGAASRLTSRTSPSFSTMSRPLRTGMPRARRAACVAT